MDAALCSGAPVYADHTPGDAPGDPKGGPNAPDWLSKRKKTAVVSQGGLGQPFKDKKGPRVNSEGGQTVGSHTGGRWGKRWGRR